MSRSVGQPDGWGDFQWFLTDEEQFANLQLWKNLLLRTCREKLWDGKIEGKRVQVWGMPTVSASFLAFIRLADPNLNLRHPTLADVGIRRRWREVGPCRVRLASLTDWANCPLFLADEEQFANLQWGKINGGRAGRSCRMERLMGSGCRFGGVGRNWRRKVEPLQLANPDMNRWAIRPDSLKTRCLRQ